MFPCLLAIPSCLFMPQTSRYLLITAKIAWRMMEKGLDFDYTPTSYLSHLPWWPQRTRALNPTPSTLHTPNYPQQLAITLPHLTQKAQTGKEVENNSYRKLTLLISGIIRQIIQITLPRQRKRIDNSKSMWYTCRAADQSLSLTDHFVTESILFGRAETAAVAFAAVGYGPVEEGAFVVFKYFNVFWEGAWVCGGWLVVRYVGGRFRGSGGWYVLSEDW